MAAKHRVTINLEDREYAELAVLSERHRVSLARLGAYFTPPALCERLLDMATEAGVDWRTARVLDPAYGGGVFLAPVARRMADSLMPSPGETNGSD